MRCIHSISLILSQQRNNSIYHGADGWINPVPRNKMLLLLCIIGSLPQDNCSARAPICCTVTPAARCVTGAVNVVLNWPIQKIGTVSLGTACTRYSLWAIAWCRSWWVSLLLRICEVLVSSIGPNTDCFDGFLLFYSVFPGKFRVRISNCAMNFLPHANCKCVHSACMNRLPTGILCHQNLQNIAAIYELQPCDTRVWTGYVYHRLGCVVGLMSTWWWNLGQLKIRGSFYYLCIY
jgi:hypothetical protein